MVLTRNQGSSFDQFSELSFNPDSNTDSHSNISSNMSDTEATSSGTEGAASLNDNTNPFVFSIDLKDKIGNTLFLQATKGLSDNEKVTLSIETAQSFKEEVDQAAADYC